jgi:hypothetical protein
MNSSRAERPIQEGVRRLSVAHFLIALLFLFVTVPFLDWLTYGDIVESVLITVVLLCAVTAVGGRPRTFLIAAVLVIPAVIGRWFVHFSPNLILAEVRLLAALLFVAFVILHLVRFIVLSPEVNSEVLCAGVATYLTLAIFWAFVYELVALLVPNSFVFTVESDPYRVMARFEALYFSLSVLTTVDFGDIVPVSNPARILAMLEAMTGVFYLAILIARMVSLYSVRKGALSVTGSQPTGRVHESIARMRDDDEHGA